MQPDRLERTLGLVAGAAAVLWLCARLTVPLGANGALAFPGASSSSALGAFLYLDPWALLVPLALLIWMRAEISRLHAALCVSALTAVTALSCASLALARYWGGHSMAWDLATFVQPMRRAAHGLPMTTTWSLDLPLWGDHGSFAFYAFAPLTRLGSDPASGLLIAQALGVAAFVPMTYVAARALSLSRAAALCGALAAASSRALLNAASFDFHPEHALPLLMLALVWAHASKRHAAVIAIALCAALLKDIAALTIGGACLYFALRDRSRSALGASGLAFAIALVDMFVLPRALGWPSYVSSTIARAPDLGLAFESTVLRGLSSGGLGWLHPFAWLSGGPWVAAAGWASKLGVKGIEYQYGFLWVPVGIAGALLFLTYLARARPRVVGAVACAFASFTALVNAPLPLELHLLVPRQRAFAHVRADLRAVVPPAASVASDACIAPLLIDHLELRGLCVLDSARFAATNDERWDLPVARALEVDRIAIDRMCGVHGECIAEQLRRAQAAGFKPVPARNPRYLVLAR